ncbi:hypothetical protein Tcan_14024 [Toxocara canis]|uniref:Uncharacterized protein n=1 Tax=Toxocara canis TaxID=6265 RepID=A0A0B2VLS5_TOXCA|nr:hypothetical protein Tcan_14024 [Toxocara canis]
MTQMNQTLANQANNNVTTCVFKPQTTFVAIEKHKNRPPHSNATNECDPSAECDPPAIIVWTLSESNSAHLTESQEISVYHPMVYRCLSSDGLQVSIIRWSTGVYHPVVYRCLSSDGLQVSIIRPGVVKTI